MHFSTVQHQSPAITLQRAHERFAVKAPGVLRLLDARSGTYVVTVLDASRTGMRVSCPIAINPDTRVEVKARDVTLIGTARYARNVDHEFHVGIEVDRVNDQIAEFDVASLFVNARPGPSRRL